MNNKGVSITQESPKAWDSFEKTQNKDQINSFYYTTWTLGVWKQNETASLNHNFNNKFTYPVYKSFGAYKVACATQ